MVIASHIIFTAYGFWLPNDPRGSWSEFVRSWELLLAGPPTKTDDRRSLAHRKHNRVQREHGLKSLKYPPVEFTGQQALCIARGFKQAIEESGYVILACSVLPRHVHAVVQRHNNPAERIIGHLKGRATQSLIASNLHPLSEFRDASDEPPSPWAQRGWKVFLDSVADIERAVKYVEDNPEKDRKPRQTWSFVGRFDPGITFRK